MTQHQYQSWSFRDAYHPAFAGIFPLLRHDPTFPGGMYIFPLFVTCDSIVCYSLAAPHTSYQTAMKHDLLPYQGCWANGMREDVPSLSSLPFPLDKQYLWTLKYQITLMECRLPAMPVETDVYWTVATPSRSQWVQGKSAWWVVILCVHCDRSIFSKLAKKNLQMSKLNVVEIVGPNCLGYSKDTV